MAFPLFSTMKVCKKDREKNTFTGKARFYRHNICYGKDYSPAVITVHQSYLKRQISFSIFFSSHIYNIMRKVSRIITGKYRICKIDLHCPFILIINKTAYLCYALKHCVVQRQINMIKHVFFTSHGAVKMGFLQKAKWSARKHTEREKRETCNVFLNSSLKKQNNMLKMTIHTVKGNKPVYLFAHFL